LRVVGIHQLFYSTEDYWQAFVDSTSS